MPVNIVDLIKRETSALRSRPALIEGGLTLTYAGLLGRVDSLATELGSRGVGRLSRVGLVSGNCIDYVTLSLAVLSLDAAIVPVSDEHTAPEIDEVMERIGVHAVIYKAAAYERTGSTSLEHEALVAGDFRFVLIGHDMGVVDKFERHLDALASLSPAFIRFSSGTTGASKGVVLSHQSIVERTDEADRGLHITSDDVVLWVLSMSFHFVVSILLYLRRGACIALCHEPFPDALVHAVKHRGGTFIYAAPFHYAMLAASDMLAPDDMKGVRMAVSTTVKLPASIAEQFHSRFGMRLTEAYGIIEVGLPFIGVHGGEGNLGRPLPGYELRIDAPDADGVGEALIKGPGMLDAYLDPWTPRESALDNGWFRTGDMGRILEDGSLVIVGRKKAVINFAGMKVFPDEVEGVIDAFSGVAESIVYPEEHERFGQLPMARLVQDKSAPAIDMRGLRAHCFKRLAAYKVPKGFTIVEGPLPRTKSGKLLRRA